MEPGQAAAIVDDSGGEVTVCSLDALDGCKAAGGSCTWCASVGASCTTAFTPFCASGVGWCTQAVCRSFCSAIDLPRCPSGAKEQHIAAGTGDVCVCTPG